MDSATTKTSITTEQPNREPYELRKGDPFPTPQSEKLEYVVLNEIGLKMVIDNHYKEKYKDKIDIDVLRYDTALGHGDIFKFMISWMNTLLDSIKENETKGCIFLRTENGKVDHASPYLLTKNDAGKNTIFYFEDERNGLPLNRSFASYVFENNKQNVLIIKKAANYTGLQSDHESCTILALTTIKNCLLDKDFISKVKKNVGTANLLWNPESISLTKTTPGQNSDFIGKLNKDKKEMYVRDRDILGGTKATNLKLFFKGHDLASRFINPEHFAKVEPHTLQIFTELNNSRRAMKGGKEPSVNFSAREFSKATGDQSAPLPDHE